MSVEVRRVLGIVRARTERPRLAESELRERHGEKRFEALRRPGMKLLEIGFGHLGFFSCWGFHGESLILWGPYKDDAASLSSVVNM